MRKNTVLIRKAGAILDDSEDEDKITFRIKPVVQQQLPPVQKSNNTTSTNSSTPNQTPFTCGMNNESKNTTTNNSNMESHNKRSSTASTREQNVIEVIKGVVVDAVVDKDKWRSKESKKRDWEKRRAKEAKKKDWASSFQSNSYNILKKDEIRKARITNISSDSNKAGSIDDSGSLTEKQEDGKGEFIKRSMRHFKHQSCRAVIGGESLNSLASSKQRQNNKRRNSKFSSRTLHSKLTTIPLHVTIKGEREGMHIDSTTGTEQKSRRISTLSAFSYGNYSDLDEESLDDGSCLPVVDDLDDSNDTLSLSDSFA